MRTFFQRKFIYNDENDEFFDDNDERTIFFCKGALETVKKLGWYPDIIHCQGWMTSLIPLYLKTLYKDEPVFSNSKIVYSVYQNDFNEDLGSDFKRKQGLTILKIASLSHSQKQIVPVFTLGGITHADAVVRCNEIDPEVEKTLSAGDKPILRSYQ